MFSAEKKQNLNLNRFATGFPVQRTQARISADMRQCLVNNVVTNDSVAFAKKI